MRQVNRTAQDRGTRSQQKAFSTDGDFHHRLLAHLNRNSSSGRHGLKLSMPAKHSSQARSLDRRIIVKAALASRVLLWAIGVVAFHAVTPYDRSMLVLSHQSHQSIEDPTVHSSHGTWSQYL